MLRVYSTKTIHFPLGIKMEFQNRWQFGGLKTIVAPASTAKRLEWLLKMEKNVITKFVWLSLYAGLTGWRWLQSYYLLLLPGMRGPLLWSFSPQQSQGRGGKQRQCTRVNTNNNKDNPIVHYTGQLVDIITGQLVDRITSHKLDF